jgi:hypothetical protein
MSRWKAPTANNSGFIKRPDNSHEEVMGTNVGVGTPRLYSPTIHDIVAWRERLAVKYRDQF